MAAMLNRLLSQAAWRWDLHVVCVMARDIETPGAPGPQPDGLLLRQVGLEDLLPHCGDAAMDLREGWVRAAFARGDECVAAFDGDTLVAYVWTSFTRAPDVNGVWVAVPAQAVYRYKALVRSAYRGRGLAPRLYHVRDAAYRARGLDRIVGFIALQNEASRAAAVKSGSHLVGYAVYRARRRGFFAWHSPAVRRLGMRFIREMS
jgi:hypothetical protein